MNNWPHRKISDMSEKITVGFVGSMSHLFQNTGIPLLRGQNIQPYKLNLKSLKYISEDTHKKWKKSALEPGDVAIVRVGYPGTACVIPQGVGPLNAASLVIIRTDPEQLNPYYLSYVLNSDWGKQKIASRLVGAAQQVFNTKVAADMNIPAPPIVMQNKIADMLGTITEKIELNRKMNETLERMGQEYFHQRYMDNPEAERVPIEKVALLERGVEPGSKNYTQEAGSGLIPFLRVGDLSSRTSNLYVDMHLTKGKIAVPNDVLVSFDGAPGLVGVGLNGCYSSGIRKVIPISDIVSTAYLYFLIKSTEVQKTIERYSEGTTIKHASRSIKHIHAYITPSRAEDHLLEEIFDQIVSNLGQIQTLTDLRDTLLPRLISGKIKM